MAAVPVSRGEIEFTLQALRREKVRVDGRALNAYRRMGIRFGAAYGEVEVNFGPTRAMAVCTGEVVTPSPERPNEGRIHFNVEFGPIASPSFEVGRPSIQATCVANLIERLLRGGRALDTEALCIVGGQKVWNIRVDIRALDDDGNLGDVCAIAALCSLLHFRKSDVEISGDQVQVYSAEERVPVPLSIHHLPVPVTFALFTPSGKETEPTYILDPNRLEEVAMGGSMCIAVNQHGELCGLHKPGGYAICFSLIEHCTELAVGRARELTDRIKAAIDADIAKRKLARRNVHKRYSGQALTVDVPAATKPLTTEPAPDVALQIEDPNPEQSRPAWRTRVEERAATGKTQNDGVSVVIDPVRPDNCVDIGANGATTDAGRPEAVSVATLPSHTGYVSAEVMGVPDDDRDLEAEIEAVAAEAAELEEQLAAATAEEIKALEEMESSGMAEMSSNAEWSSLGNAAGTTAEKAGTKRALAQEEDEHENTQSQIVAADGEVRRKVRKKKRKTCMSQA